MFDVGFRLQTGATVFCWSGRGAHHWVFLWWVAYFRTRQYLVPLAFLFFFAMHTHSWWFLLINISFCSKFWWIMSCSAESRILGVVARIHIFLCGDSVRLPRCESRDSWLVNFFCSPPTGDRRVDCIITSYLHKYMNKVFVSISAIHMYRQVSVMSTYHTYLPQL